MSTHDFDGPAAAVQHATKGADSWRSAVHAQQAATSDHSDWYAVTGEVVNTLRCLFSLADLFASQISGYGSGRVVRDDAGMAPAERLDRAVLHAQSLRAFLLDAEAAADAFWNEISHIAVGDRS
jgi:hypothetical protein